MAEDADFELKADGERRPALYYKGDLLGHLAKGRSLIAPLFQPLRAVGALEGDALRDVTTRAEAWISAMLEKHLGGIVALHTLSQDAAVDGNVRALAIQLAEEGGIAGRGYVADALRGLPKDARGAARKGGIVFGALDVYHHAALKPAAAKWRAALFAARDERPMPDLPPESAVHLTDWNFASLADCRNAGYRRIGEEYLRIDLAERVIKKAHEARGQDKVFAFDMTFATSLGLSETGLNALMRDAGFKKSEAPVAAEESVDEAPAPNAKAEQPTAPVSEKAASEAPIAEPAPATPDEPAPEKPQPENPEPVLTHWRWVGMRNSKAPGKRPSRGAKDDGAKGGKAKAAPSGTKSPQRTETVPPSSLALQLAALQELHPPKSGK